MIEPIILTAPNGKQFRFSSGEDEYGHHIAIEPMDGQANTDPEISLWIATKTFELSRGAINDFIEELKNEPPEPPTR